MLKKAKTTTKKLDSIFEMKSSLSYLIDPDYRGSPFLQKTTVPGESTIIIWFGIVSPQKMLWQDESICTEDVWR